MWLHEQTSCQWVLHQWFQWWSAKRQSLTQAASGLRTVRSAIHLCSGWRHRGWRVLCYWRLATTSLTKMTESVWHAALGAPTAAAAVSWALSVTARCEALILHRHKELTVWSQDLRARRRQVATPQGMYRSWAGGRGVGGPTATVIGDKSRQKRGVISAVWVTNCWTSGLNGLRVRKTPNKEARMWGELGLLRHRWVEIIHFTLF